MNDFQVYLKEKTNFFETELKKELQELSYPETIAKGMEYAILNGGKRLRPFLLFATLELLNQNIEKGVKSAIALEMIHSYSLVHDDLPALDNDDYRRGKLTTHKVFGEAEGILIGDSLLTYAFYILSQKNLKFLSSEQIVNIISKTSEYAGINGMIGGQMIDIESENKKIDLETLKYIHSHKTGKLIKLPIEIACIIANVEKDKKEVLEEYANLIGLAFQVKDDILDVEGTFEELGKPVGSDVDLHKATYPSILGMEESKKILNDTVEKAKEIIGRTAKHTEIIRPLKNGVISNYEVTERMLEEFLHRIKKDRFQSSRVIICVPSGVTQVERRAVIEVVKDAGAKEVYLIEEPIAAAIGVGIDLFEPKGHLIVDIGGGTTEIAFIVSGGAALSRSIKIAGDHLNEDIMEFVKEKHNLLIGERTAEELKMNTISQEDPNFEYEIRGRELGVGLPKSMKIKASQIDGAIRKHIDAIIDEVRLTIEEIEPEVAADIYETGIYLSGGGAGIRILKEKIEKELKLKVTVSDDAIHSVVNGIAVVLDDFEKYKNIIISHLKLYYKNFF